MWERTNRTLVYAIPGIVLLAVVSAGCSSSAETETATGTETATTQTLTSTSTTVPSTTATTATSTTIVSVTTTTTAPTTTQPPQTTTTLPGAPYTGPGPQIGDLVAVVGVAYDDVLNVRQGPGVRFSIVGMLKPTTLDASVTSQGWLLPSSVWYEIEDGSIMGWVSSAYIGQLGATDDATLEVFGILGEPLADDDLAALGATIAFAFLGEEGGGWIALVEPSEGGSPTAVSSITYDVIGLGDDAIKGYRLVIHATQDVENGPFTLHSVERTSICWRGVDADGLCV